MSLLLPLVGIACSPATSSQIDCSAAYKPASVQDYCNSKQQAEDLFAKDMFEYQMKIKAENYKRINAMEGDAAFALWERCNSDPPKQPTNQKRCQAIIDRVRKDMAADDARIAAREKNW
jgi:hypothetical protein